MGIWFQIKIWNFEVIKNHLKIILTNKVGETNNRKCVNDMKEKGTIHLINIEFHMNINILKTTCILGHIQC